MVHSLPREDEVESPFLVPPHNVIDLDSEATIVQVLVCHPFIPLSPPPPPPSKASKIRKKLPLITLPNYSWVHEEVRSYESDGHRVLSC